MCTLLVKSCHVERMHYVTFHSEIQVREKCKLSTSESKITQKGLGKFLYIDDSQTLITTTKVIQLNPLIGKGIKS